MGGKNGDGTTTWTCLTLFILPAEADGANSTPGDTGVVPALWGDQGAELRRRVRAAMRAVDYACHASQLLSLLGWVEALEEASLCQRSYKAPMGTYSAFGSRSVSKYTVSEAL